MDDERILEWLTSQDVIEVRLLLDSINNLFFLSYLQNKRKKYTKAILGWSLSLYRIIP
jgi:hypothetical protein